MGIYGHKFDSLIENKVEDLNVFLDESVIEEIITLHEAANKEREKMVSKFIAAIRLFFRENGINAKLSTYYDFGGDNSKFKKGSGNTLHIRIDASSDTTNSVLRTTAIGGILSKNSVANVAGQVARVANNAYNNKKRDDIDTDVVKLMKNKKDELKKFIEEESGEKIKKLSFVLGDGNQLKNSYFSEIIIEV